MCIHDVIVCLCNSITSLQLLTMCVFDKFITTTQTKLMVTA